MDGTQFDETPANNAVFALFSFLGALCAILVGIAIFDPESLKKNASRAPASEPPSPTELRMDLPILD
jgi:hypothetical protein